MPKDINVMITSARVGSAVSAIKALKRQNHLCVIIHTIDASSHSAGLYLADT